MTILEKNKNLKESDTPINALPEYKIRTMKDDLAGKGLKELEKEAIKAAPPKELPIVEEKIEKTLEQTIPEPPKSEKKIKEKKVKPPKPKKIKPDKEKKKREKQEKKEQKRKEKEEQKQQRKEQKEKEQEEPKKIEKAPLPSVEELISSKLPEPPKPKEIKPVKPKKIKEPKEKKVKPVKEKKIKEPKKPKKWLAWLLIVILIAVIVIAIFYLIGSEPDPEPTPEPPTPLESLIPVDETKVLSLTNTSFIDLLSQEAERDQSAGTFKRVAILKNETEFLSLSELLEKLNINIPPYAFIEIEDSYTLVIYSQNGKKKLELITEVKNTDNLNEQLRFWEQTMVNDLQGLFLIESPGTPATNDFQDNVYKDTTIRYINFPEPDLTIDYAITNNLLIIGTSKELMYKTIDKIVDNL